jgi:NAD(P)-dependent dehydrogenase (short-subunit alcohol dehydrogenase family)
LTQPSAPTAAEGANVVVAGRRVDVGKQLVADIGSGALFVRADVTVETDVEALMSTALQCFGSLDCLVNSAGGGGTQWSITQIEMERFQRTMAIHVGGVATAMRYAAPIMIDQGSGSIINVASNAGLLAGWSHIDYSCAKAAVIHLTRCSAVELGEHGVRVNSVSPGPILTGIFAKGAGVDPAEADRRALELEPTFASWLAPWRPLRRVGVPLDVAAAALWLASDASSLITGHDLPVDGGMITGPPASVFAESRAELAQHLGDAVRQSRLAGLAPRDAAP